MENDMLANTEQMNLPPIYRPTEAARRGNPRLNEDRTRNQGNGRRAQNVGQAERLATGALAAVVAGWGLKRHDPIGIAMVALASGMAYRAASGYCPAYAALNIGPESQPAQPNEYDTSGNHVVHSVTIDRPRNELFTFWRELSNLPQVMSHLVSVTTVEGNRSHWVAKAPAGRTVEWDAEIINEVPDETIAWRSLAGADVDNTGSVRFLDAPGGRGTVIKVTLEYIPPAGAIGKWVARLFGKEPKQQIREDLRRFKRQIETGEVPTTEGQPKGSCGW
jgi:uncharacterized membrane protein